MWATSHQSLGGIYASLRSDLEEVKQMVTLSELKARQLESELGREKFINNTLLHQLHLVTSPITGSRPGTSSAPSTSQPSPVPAPFTSAHNDSTKRAPVNSAAPQHSFITPPRVPKSASAMNGVHGEVGRASTPTAIASTSATPAPAPSRAVASPPPSALGSASRSRSPGLSPIASARRPRSADSSGSTPVVKETNAIAPDTVREVHSLQPTPPPREGGRASSPELASSPTRNPDTASYNDTSFLDFLSDDTDEVEEVVMNTGDAYGANYSRYPDHDRLFIEASIEIEPLESHTPPRGSNTRRPAPRTHLIPSAASYDATWSTGSAGEKDEGGDLNEGQNPDSHGGGEVISNDDYHRDAMCSSFLENSTDRRYGVSIPVTPLAGNTAAVASTARANSAGSSHSRSRAVEVSPGVVLRSVRSMDGQEDASFSHSDSDSGSVGWQTIEDVHETLRSMSLLEVSNDDYRRVVNDVPSDNQRNSSSSSNVPSELDRISNGSNSLSYSASTYEAAPAPEDLTNSGIDAAAIRKNIIFPNAFKTPERVNESISRGIAFDSVEGNVTTPQFMPQKSTNAGANPSSATRSQWGLVRDVNHPGDSYFDQVSGVHLDADHTGNVVDSLDLDWTFSSERDSRFHRDIQPRDIQPRDIQPRDIQPGDIQPRDIQPRDIQPRDIQPSESAAIPVKVSTRNSPTAPVPGPSRGRDGHDSRKATPAASTPPYGSKSSNHSISKSNTGPVHAPSFASEYGASFWPPKRNSAEMWQYQDEQHSNDEFKRYMEFVAFMKYQEHLKQSQRTPLPASASATHPSPPPSLGDDAGGAARGGRRARFKDDDEAAIAVEQRPGEARGAGYRDEFKNMSNRPPAVVRSPSSETEAGAAGVSRSAIAANVPGGHVGRIRLNYSSPLPGEVPAPTALKLQSPSFEALRFDNVPTSTGKVSVPEYRKEMHKMYGYNSISPLSLSPSGNAEYWKRRMFVRHHI